MSARSETAKREQRMDNLNALSHWVAGEAVQGSYCNVPFTGHLTDATRPTPDYKNVVFVVWLDQPIIVFGRQTQRIEVWSNGNIASDRVERSAV